MVINELPKELSPLRLIIPTMAMGMIIFGIITLILGSMGDPEEMVRIEKLLLLALLALPIVELPAFFALRMGMMKKLQNTVSGMKPDECIQPIAAAYLQITLMGAAMAEGIGLFGIVIVLLTGNMLGWLAPVAALLVLYSMFPRIGAFQSFAGSVTGRYGL